MSIRTKLTLAMGSLIVIIMLCLLAVTRIQFYILRDFAYAQDRPRFLALEQEFERFYRGNGRSWEKVETADFPQAAFFPEMLLKTDEGVEFHKGTVPLNGMYNDSFPLILEEDGRRIGILFVMNERQTRIYELKEMWYDILPNILKVSLGVTFLAALIIIFFLTRRLTRPIRRILNGINAIERGEPDGKLPIARRDEFGAIALALHRMNENWSRAEASRKQLLSDVAHELRTPLMIIQGELELVLETNRPMTERKASSLLDEVLRLSRLVHDVLDLSKLEAERTDLKKSEESLASLAGQLIEKTRFLAEDKAISLTLEEPAAEVRVQVDKARLMQALYNLLANAIHYTERGGSVRLTIGTEYREDKRGTFASLAFADTGIGIAAEELPHIFDRFYRADASRTRSGTSGGTGLGLAIANQNVRLHGGWIEVESEPGRGSCFTVYLPLEELRGSLG